ncbi:hypothetical protein AKJ16_DCAP19594 [Drosera capensis]
MNSDERKFDGFDNTLAAKNIPVLFAFAPKISQATQWSSATVSLRKEKKHAHMILSNAGCREGTPIRQDDVRSLSPIQFVEVSSLE